MKQGNSVHSHNVKKFPLWHTFQIDLNKKMQYIISCFYKKCSYDLTPRKIGLTPYILGHSLHHTNHISAVKEWLIRDMMCINNFCFNNFFLTIHTSSKFHFKNISKLSWNNLKTAMFVFILKKKRTEKNQLKLIPATRESQQHQQVSTVLYKICFHHIQHIRNLINDRF